ncbi:AAA family ATPase [Alkalimarinus coralli]|uniref:AAA family ATPase n=1 Tax=Alkalimarinus coralli TaxID=2935863 RepID=UPI00202B5F38|nr:AAA family ATPase [Alkalimarinus coralli]
MKSYHYPFCAVVGQSALKQALLLSAIDSKLGGVLISGPRGMGKTTLARGLGELLSEHSLTKSTKPFVTLPLGATEEKLVGSLDIERVLANGEVAFSPGLLSRAHNGILYVDEVNLLPDHLVDLLLDVAASGINHVERDGITKEHESKFVLIGTMNPDEGELRPQLQDRFGLFVDINERLNPKQRVEAVKKRLEFDDNPVSFLERHAEQQQTIHNELVCAQALLPEVVIGEAEQLDIAERCEASGVEGLRADITLQRAAKAQAAWHGEVKVSTQHIDEVEEFVLAHRRTTTPPNEPQPPKHKNHSPDDAATPPSQGSRPYADRGSRFKQPRSQAGSNGASEEPSNKKQNNEGQWGAIQPSAMATSGKRVINKPKTRDQKRVKSNITHGQKGFGNAKVSAYALGLRSQTKKAQRVAWVPTLTDGQNIQRLRDSNIRGSEKGTPARLSTLHYLKPQQKPGQLNLVLIDSSASTGSQQSLGKAKGAVSELSHQSYLERQELAIIAFGNNKVSTLLHPQRAPKDIDPILNQITLGGGTPLRKALAQAKELLHKAQSRAPSKNLHLYVLTDGRSNDDISAFSSISASTGAVITVIDTEQHAIRLERCRAIAALLNANYQHIDDLPDRLETEPPLINGAFL